MSAQIEFHQKRGDLGKMEVKGGGNFRRRIRVGLAESGGGGSKVPLLTTY